MTPLCQKRTKIPNKKRKLHFSLRYKTINNLKALKAAYL